MLGLGKLRAILTKITNLLLWGRNAGLWQSKEQPFKGKDDELPRN